jgi:hypothetical protein
MLPVSSNRRNTIVFIVSYSTYFGVCMHSFM